MSTLLCVQVANQADKMRGEAHFNHCPPEFVVLRNIGGLGEINERQIKIFCFVLWLFVYNSLVDDLVPNSSSWSETGLFWCYFILQFVLDSVKNYYGEFCLHGKPSAIVLWLLHCSRSLFLWSGAVWFLVHPLRLVRVHHLVLCCWKKVLVISSSFSKQKSTNSFSIFLVFDLSHLPSLHTFIKIIDPSSLEGDSCYNASAFPNVLTLGTFLNLVSNCSLSWNHTCNLQW